MHAMLLHSPPHRPRDLAPCAGMDDSAAAIGRAIDAQAHMKVAQGRDPRRQREGTLPNEVSPDRRRAGWRTSSRSSVGLWFGGSVGAGGVDGEGEAVGGGPFQGGGVEAVYLPVAVGLDPVREPAQGCEVGGGGLAWWTERVIGLDVVQVALS